MTTGGKSQVGRYHEKRGEDHLTVYVSDDGQVLQIEQFDSKDPYRRTLSVDFWAESAPHLIALIQKAAGIEPEKIEYEYAVQGFNIQTGEPYTGAWMDKRLSKIALQEFEERPEEFGYGRRAALFTGFKIVKRRKAGKVEDV